MILHAVRFWYSYWLMSIVCIWWSDSFSCFKKLCWNHVLLIGHKTFFMDHAIWSWSGWLAKFINSSLMFGMIIIGSIFYHLALENRHSLLSKSSTRLCKAHFHLSYWKFSVCWIDVISNKNQYLFLKAPFRARSAWRFFITPRVTAWRKL